MRRSLEHSRYHSFLRVAALASAFVLVFDSGLLSDTTATISRGAQQYVATAVGVRVGVAPNEVNVLTARITELEGELARKEREIAVNLNSAPTSQTNTSTFVLSAILFILLVLIVLNYILDYVRSRDNLTARRVGVSR